MPLDDAIASFHRWLRYENKSERTQQIYTSAATKLARWLEAHSVTDWEQAERNHVRDFLIEVRERGGSAGYANQLFRSLQQFFKFSEAEDNRRDIMVGMSPPTIPEQPVPVLRNSEIKALIKACEGTDFRERRDMAMVRLFLDTGLRRTELLNLTVDDVDLDYREVTVMGKGRRRRTVGFGTKAAWALDRYLTQRRRHRYADLPDLWLGERNKPAMTGSGIAQVLRRRGRAAGIDNLRPHDLRHTWAHLMKVRGVADDEMMKLGGWRSTQMLQRYAASTASERARDTARRLAPGDQF